MKKCVSVICILAVILTASGCSSSFQPSVTSIYIQDNGKITQAIVESFEKEYYSSQELQSMIEKEVDAYNSGYGEERITIQKADVEADTLYLLIDFQDADTYGQYNEVYCFSGTVEQALDEGLSFDMLFKDTQYEEYSAADVTEKKSDSVVVLKEEEIVQLQRPVKYVSNNVDIISERMVQVMPIEEEEEYAYIIY
ncbi:MAG: hypothetical protein K1W25_03440 [Lachnospiraceae bacterium]